MSPSSVFTITSAHIGSRREMCLTRADNLVNVLVDTVTLLKVEEPVRLLLFPEPDFAFQSKDEKQKDILRENRREELDWLR